MVVHYVAQVLRQVVPLMEHPSESFLASLEEDLVKLVMKHGQMVSRSVCTILCDLPLSFSVCVCVCVCLHT